MPVLGAHTQFLVFPIVIVVLDNDGLLCSHSRFDYLDTLTM